MLTIWCSLELHQCRKVLPGLKVKTTIWPWCFKIMAQSHRFYRLDIPIPVSNRRNQTLWCHHRVTKIDLCCVNHQSWMTYHTHVLARRADISLVTSEASAAHSRKKTKISYWIDILISSGKLVILEPHL